MFWLMRCGLFFFFQAEDGIRDIGVTGVQTCALPISDARWIPPCPRTAGDAWALANPAVAALYADMEGSIVHRPFVDAPIPLWFALVWLCDSRSPIVQRSEERRVGKECRSRLAGRDYK